MGTRASRWAAGSTRTPCGVQFQNWPVPLCSSAVRVPPALHRTPSVLCLRSLKKQGAKSLKKGHNSSTRGACR